MASIIVNGQEYRLVSRAKGQYAGPCPFGMGGDDRCGIFPQKEDGVYNYYCRKTCANCPGDNVERTSGGTTGWINNAESSGKIIEPQGKPPPSLNEALEFHKHLSKPTLDYLAMRGIRENTADKFLIGTNCRRFTIPCITNNGVTKCHGIKKRWIGDKYPKNMKYTMIPGSKAKAIYNFDRLTSRKHWDYFLIVESVMDVLVMEQIGIPSVAPFGGGRTWSVSWNDAFKHCDHVIHVSDNDEAGLGYAQDRREAMNRGIVTLPPGAERFGCSDLGDSYLEFGAGVIQGWFVEKQQEIKEQS